MKIDEVTIDDVRTGRRARLNQKETARLTGRSASSLERDRYVGKGMPFSKDENGRVWYAAEDVLAYVQRDKHRSTSEYSTAGQALQAERARSVMTKRA